MAARTRVYIDATADQLVREISRAERALERLGREGLENGTQASAGMNKATLATRAYAAATTGAASATARIGSAARTAAPYVGAGLALGLAKSVAEAREAEKALAQTEAVLKSMGTEANVTAGEVGRLAKQISLKSGIDDEAIQQSENLLLTFKSIHNEVGKGNDIFTRATQATTDLSVAWDQDLSSSAKMLGKALNDPVAGLTSLTRVGVQFTQQQKDQITALVENGEQLKAQRIIMAEVESQVAGSAAAQADSFDKLKVSAENFAEGVGKEVIPVLSDMADGLSDILSDKSLTGAERTERLGAFFEEWAQKGIDALEDAAPQIAETGAQIGIMTVKAFGNAFMDSGVLGKLFLGAGALRFFGGPGIIGKLGGALATRMAAGMASVAPVAFTPVGALIALSVASAYAGYKSGLGDKVTNGMKKDGREIVEQWDRVFDELELGFRHAGAAADQMSRGLRITKSDFKAAAQGVNYFSEALDDTADDMRRFERVIERKMDDVGDATEDAGKAIEKFATDGGNDLDRFTAKSARMAKGVGKNIMGVASVVTDGLGIIGKNTNEALSAFGVKKVALSLENVGDAASNFQAGGSVFQVPGHGNGDSFQTAVPAGSFILNREASNAFFGLQSGGMSPVVLEPGELAFSPGAVAQFGGALQSMNSAVPRFARGGVAQPPGDPGSEVVQAGYEQAVGRFLQTYGMDLTQGYGGASSPSVSPGHTTLGVPPSLDVVPLDGNWDGSFAQGLKWALSQGMQVGYDGQYGTQAWSGHGEGNHAHIDWLASAGKVGAVGKSIKRLLLSGPDGPMKSMGQSSLDMARKAANAFLSKQMPGPSGDVGTPGAPIKSLPGPLRQYNKTYPSATLGGEGDWYGLYQMPANAIAALAEWAGKGRVPGWTMEQVQEGEGTFRPGSRSTDGGYGLWAITRPFGDSYLDGLSYEDMNNPVLNAQVMAKMYPTGWSGGSPWYGDSHVTDYNKHYSGSMLSKQRGGFVGGKGHSPAYQRGGAIHGSMSTIPFGANPPPSVKPPKLSYEEQLTVIAIALSNAEQTDITADDLALLQQRGDLIGNQLGKAQENLANVSLTDKDKLRATASARADVSRLEKKLSRGGLSNAEARRLDAARRRAYRENASEILGDKRTEARDKVSELTDELNSNTDQMKALTEEGISDLISTIEALTEAQTEQNRILTSESRIQSAETLRALADLLSGEIGGAVSYASMTPGNGSVVAA